MRNQLVYEVASRADHRECCCPRFITTAMTYKLTDDQKREFMAKILRVAMAKASKSSGCRSSGQPEPPIYLETTLHCETRVWPCLSLRCKAFAKSACCAKMGRRIHDRRP